MTHLIVIYDACILYSAPLRDLFMRLALTDLYQAKWTKDIHHEWIRNLHKNRPDIPKERLRKISSKMDMHVRDCLVHGYKKFIKKIELPDPNDRHVVAAAMCAKAQIIITFNLSDFPTALLKKYNIKAQHPDDFLCQLLKIAPIKIINTVQETRLSLKNPPKTIQEYLTILKQQSLHQTVNYLQNYIDLM